ncbi:hypothetical protein HY628_01580 [Candidatus Uhrbacteria bacterium]|nr:hypothetical protein [Candidatus Uhrbacteria bacterium]
MRTLFKFGFLFMLLAVLGLGCIQFRRGPKEADGGVWRSSNAGEEWQQKKVLLTAEGLQSIGEVNVTTLTTDPQDPLALYAGTSSYGLLYSYDNGDSWQRAKQLAEGQVNSVAVDPKDKCTIYAALGPRIWKSTDCNRSFSPVYFETRSGIVMTQVEVDWFNPQVLYAGTSSGDLLKSVDGGGNWARLDGFDDFIVEIYLDPFDSRIVFVGLADGGIWKSADGGATWADLKSGLEEFDRGRGLAAIVSDGLTRNTFLVATSYGILRTTDGGASWQALNLPTPPGSITIYSLAVNPRNVNEIYYGTAATFYRSQNGGANWTTKKLPAARAATALLVSPQDPYLVYLGTTLFKR